MGNKTISQENDSFSLGLNNLIALTMNKGLHTLLSD